MEMRRGWKPSLGRAVASLPPFVCPIRRAAAQMKTIRILVADDEPLARRGVRQLLAKHEDMTVVGECRNGRDTLRAIETLVPDLLFLDVQMPEMDGFEVIRIVGVH